MLGYTRLGLTVVVDYLEKLLGVWDLQRFRGHLLAEAQELEVVDLPDDLGALCCLHRPLGQMAALVVEQAVRITTPCDALHQHPRARGQTWLAGEPVDARTSLTCGF